MSGPRRPYRLFLVIAVLVLIGLVGPGCIRQADATTGCRSGAGSVGHKPRRAPRIRTWLHPCPDGTLRTSKGRRIRIEGLEYLQSGWGAVGAGMCNSAYAFPRKYAAGDVARWGFNTVHLFISWQSLEP